jgi:Na+/H+-dicarboxylate symporter
MKIWIKFLIGSVLGIIIALILPAEGFFMQKLLPYMTKFAIRFGRYLLLPLIFFSMTVSVYKLRESGILFKTAVKTSLVIIISSLILTAIGVISGLIIKLPRIPIPVEKISQSTSFDIAGNLLKIFPESIFSVFLDGAYLLPLYVLAGFAGAGCYTDNNISKPILTLFDSLSKVCYSIMCFFTDMLAFGMIPIAASWTVDFLAAFKTGIFNNLIILLTIDFIIVTFIIFPLILRFKFKEFHPFRILYASITSILTAFLSGDTNLVLALNMRHGKESLGIHRRINSVTMPVFSTFSRGGSALVISICFIIILRSYSSLGIKFFDVIWLFATAFACSFFLGALPTGGTFSALTIICSFYGRGYAAGYLLLKPIAPLLCAFAAAFDAVVAMFGSYLIASQSKLTEHKDTKYFI